MTISSIRPSGGRTPQLSSRLTREEPLKRAEPCVAWPDCCSTWFGLLLFADEDQEEGVVTLLRMCELGRPSLSLELAVPAQLQVVLLQLVDTLRLYGPQVAEEIDLLRLLRRVQSERPLLLIAGRMLERAGVALEDDAHRLHLFDHFLVLHVLVHVRVNDPGAL